MSQHETARSQARHYRRIAAASLVLTACLAACTATQDGAAPHGIDTAAVLPTPTYMHTVTANERLSDIARDLTGDADNWRAIARLNGIVDARRLAVGAVLEIPSHLVEAPSVVELVDWDVVEPAALPPVQTTASRQHQPRLEPAPVVVSAVTTNRQFELRPLAPGVSTASAGSRNVKVVGSYFPKGIYTRPDGASRVIMRVAPGTLLSLDREYDSWYKVSTSEGEGYLRSADGEVLRRVPATPSGTGAGS